MIVVCDDFLSFQGVLDNSQHLRDILYIVYITRSWKARAGPVLSLLLPGTVHSLHIR